MKNDTIRFDTLVSALLTMTADAKLELARELGAQFDELNSAELNLLSRVLTVPYCTGLMDKAMYDELAPADCKFVRDLYWRVDEELSDRYRAENEPAIRKMFAEKFEGKSREDIDPVEWSYYSDRHKDVFGYRPHGIVCGVYINPHR